MLKRNRVHWIIDLAKGLGLKNKVYGGADSMPVLSVDDRKWLIDLHRDAIDFCESELGWEVEGWRGSGFAAG